MKRGKRLIGFIGIIGLISPYGLYAQFSGMPGAGSGPPGSFGSYTPPEGSGMSQTYSLTIQKQGTGAGIVRGAGGIECGSACSGVFIGGMSAMVMAEADAGSEFAGWSGACSGQSGTCSVIMDENKTITAMFNVVRSQGNKGSGNEGGDEGFNWWNYWGDSEVFNFIEEVARKKIKKPYQISVFGRILSIFKKPFDPATMLGAKWKINTNNAAEPLAQGNLVGPGSYIHIAIGLYTGMVRVALQGKESWNAVYENRGNAQVAELSWKNGFYQRETVMDEAGNPAQIVALAEGETVFAATPNAVMFAVRPGAFPAPLAGAAAHLAVPRGGPLVPIEKILEMVGQGMANAAPKPVSEHIREYRKIQSEMEKLQQKYSELNFEDPDLDYDAVQSMIDQFDFLDQSLGVVRAAMRQFRMFVREVGWREERSQAAYALMQGGMDPSLASLIAQGAPPFDFYVVEGYEMPTVRAGSCQFNGVCTLRALAPKDAERVKKAAENSYAALIGADAVLAKTEEALFGGEGS